MIPSLHRPKGAGFLKPLGRTVLASIVATAFSATACRAGLFDESILNAAGPVGAGDMAILLDSLAIMLAIVIPTIAMTLFVAWKFRASNTKTKYLPDWEYSGKIELVVWSIPLMVVLFLGGVGWVGSHELDPHHSLASKQKPIEVDVVSMDWKWLFIYPDLGIASVNRLTIPVGVPVEFKLTSMDVMNSFFVPRLGSQIYTMAGMVTRLSLEASQPGTFPGISAQFSGDGFSDMHFVAMALPKDQFAQWAAAAQSSSPILDDAAYTALLKPSEANPATTYKTMDPGLFRKMLAESAPGSDTDAQYQPVTEPVSLPTPARTKD